ncbi:DUF6624 domain-containing protein [Dysgonomonas termitidis]|uniref:DUF6624 domain-containing protein n=1 Tax=Dysgonomonas termitidis TaxID=1516126 RepID=A0ABV9L1D8_9BACT
MKKIFILFLFVQIPFLVKAQTLSELQDSCYYYIEHNDTLSFNNAYVKIFNIFEQEMNPEIYSLKNELRKMGNNDQSIRILLMDSQKKYGETDLRTKNIRRIMNGIDSLNAGKVTQIIDKYGWLSSDDIGEEASDAIFLCIQHCSDATIQNKYLPVLEDAVKKGTVKGWQYAFLTDRCLMNQGKTQIYGTQTILSKDKKTYLVPLQDIENVNKLRKEIGLEPLEEYLRSFGEDWSKEKYMEELPRCKEIYDNWYKNKK